MQVMASKSITNSHAICAAETRSNRLGFVSLGSNALAFALAAVVMAPVPFFLRSRLRTFSVAAEKWRADVGALHKYSTEINHFIL
jgi:hypothetical protein